MVSVLVKWSSLERLLFCVKQLPERAKDFDMILSNFAFILKKKQTKIYYLFNCHRFFKRILSNFDHGILRQYSTFYSFDI